MQQAELLEEANKEYSRIVQLVEEADYEVNRMVPPTPGTVPLSIPASTPMVSIHLFINIASFYRTGRPLDQAAGLCRASS